MRPFAQKHREYLLEEICKNTVILLDYRFVNKKVAGDYNSVLLFPNRERELYLSGLGFKVYTDEHYDPKRLLFSNDKLLDWFIDDSKTKLDFSFSLKCIFLMK